MKDTANNTERKYTFVEKLTGKPETDKQIDALNEELDRTKKHGAIAIAVTAVVGAASTIGATIIVKKKFEPKYMTLGQIINLGKYPEYKELVTKYETALDAEKTAVTAAKAADASDETKNAATAAIKARKKAEEELEEFTRIDGDDDKNKNKKNKKKNENKSKGKKNSDGEDDE